MKITIKKLLLTLHRQVHHSTKFPRSTGGQKAKVTDLIHTFHNLKNVVLHCYYRQAHLWRVYVETKQENKRNKNLSFKKNTRVQYRECKLMYEILTILLLNNAQLRSENW